MKWKLISALSLVGGLLAGAAQAQDVRTLTFSHTEPSIGIRQKGAELFAEKVKDYTKGAYKIDIFPGGQLANDARGVEQLQIGGIDITVTGPVAFGGLVPEINLTTMPYILDSYQHGWAFMDNSPWLKSVYLKFPEKGLRILANWEVGFRNFSTRSAFATPQDMAGWKIRIFNNDLILWTMQSLGMNPIAMPVTEAFLAIQQGAVEGQENAVAEIYTRRFYEVAPYITLTQHMYNPGLFAISEKTWQSLPQADQEAFTRAAREAGDMVRQEIVAQEGKTLDIMREKGAHISKPDLAPFKAAVQPVYDKARQQYGADVVNHALKDAEDARGLIK